MDFLSLGFNIITIIITIIVLIVAIVYISKHGKSITKLEEDVSTNKKNISAIPTYTLQKLINELSEDDIASILNNVNSETINKGIDKLTKEEFLKFKENIDKINEHMDKTYENHIKEKDDKKDDKKDDEKDDKTNPNNEEEKTTPQPSEEEPKEGNTTEQFTLMYPANSMYIQKVNYLI